MLVRIVKDWPYPESFFGQTPKGDGVWGDITFTEDKVSKCDYLIVLQRPLYSIDVTCPTGNAWIITQEPPTNYFRFFIKSFRYFDRVYSYYTDIEHPFIRSMQPVLPWHLLKNYKELSSINAEKLTHKKDDLVWITSNKRGFAGQKARMIFKDYLQASKFKFHLYGNGFQPIYDKFDGLYPCKYSLAIENYSIDHYWTEKIADSLLSWCLPFYWGANNLEEYFSPDCFIRINIDEPDEALEIIKEAIENNEWEKRLSAIEEARNKILNEYQFFPYVAKMVREDSLTNINKPLKNYHIPKNPYPRHYKIINHAKYYLKRLFRL